MLFKISYKSQHLNSKDQTSCCIKLIIYKTWFYLWPSLLSTIMVNNGGTSHVSQLLSQCLRMRTHPRPAEPNAAEESRRERVGGALFGRKTSRTSPVRPGRGALYGSAEGEGKSAAAFGAACAHQTLLIEHTVRQSWSGNTFLCRNMREFLK